MTSSEPIVSAAELAVYMNDQNLNVDRAEGFIADAQRLALTVVNPLPDGAALIVKRVAGRAYVTVTSSRQAQLAMTDPAYGGSAPGGRGGVYLDRYDRDDLQALAADAAPATQADGVFSVDLLPAGFVPPIPATWDGWQYW